MDTTRDLTLILLYLTSWFEKSPVGGQRRSWKTYPFHVLDQLEEEGLITGGHRTKSVWLTEEGEKEARALLRQCGLPETGDRAEEEHTPKSGPVPETGQTGAREEDSLKLIVVASRYTSLRCIRLPERGTVTLRPLGGIRDQMEGEILKVLVKKEWRYAGNPYISGKILESYIDGSVLTPVPLGLYEQGEWDPVEEVLPSWEEELGEKHRSKKRLDLPDWAQAVLDAGKRHAYEMEQVIPGQDPTDPDSDPIAEAVEKGRAGDKDAAFSILQECLEQDLRCIDAYVHIGNLRAGDLESQWAVENAEKCYQAGVAVGERALPPGFNGLIPWGMVDNRPFLRALHGLALCRWRLADPVAARGIFMRLLMLDPMDPIGARFPLCAIDSGRSYPEFAAQEQGR